MPVVYTGSVPDLFSLGRDVRLEGSSRSGVFVGDPDTLITKCPSKYAAEQVAQASMPELGRAALVVALGLALYAAVAGGVRGRHAPRRLALSAQNALLAAVRRDRSSPRVVLARRPRPRTTSRFVYVADHTSRDLPTGYTLSAFWGGQEGSLLLWLLVLTGYSAAAVAAEPPQRAATSSPGSCPCSAASPPSSPSCSSSSRRPFATQAAPADGAGLNPSLQNPYMLAHPPLLYLGYVGLTVPCAFAMGALLARRTDERWIVATRRWTLVAWTSLGVGQLLGAHWAYEEVGWGGYYAWDPVENAALMPWLAATAFLHSVMIQEKRGMLKVWNVLLVILAFGALALRHVPHALRDRQLDPLVHRRARSGRGSSASSASSSLVSLALVFARPAAAADEDAARVARLARGDVPLQQPAARRARLTILWGVAFPILSEAVPGERGHRRRGRTTTSSCASSGCRCCC